MNDPSPQPSPSGATSGPALVLSNSSKNLVVSASLKTLGVSASSKALGVLPSTRALAISASSKALGVSGSSKALVLSNSGKALVLSNSGKSLVLSNSGKSLVLSNSGKRIDQAGKKKYVKQVTGRHNDTELHLAAGRGDLDAVKQILSEIDAQMTGTLSGADFDAEVAEIRAAVVDEVNELGETALFTAAEKGHLDVVKELLQYSTKEGISMKNQSGFDALHIAASKGHQGKDKFEFHEHLQPHIISFPFLVLLLFQLSLAGISCSCVLHIGHLDRVILGVEYGRTEPRLFHALWHSFSPLDSAGNLLDSVLQVS